MGIPLIIVIMVVVILFFIVELIFVDTAVDMYMAPVEFEKNARELNRKRDKIGYLKSLFFKRWVMLTYWNMANTYCNELNEWKKDRKKYDPTPGFKKRRFMGHLIAASLTIIALPILLSNNIDLNGKIFVICLFLALNIFTVVKFILVGKSIKKHRAK
jgi:hypothetical protein